MKNWHILLISAILAGATSSTRIAYIKGERAASSALNLVDSLAVETEPVCVFSFRVLSDGSWGDGPPCPNHRYRDVYKVVGGKIALVRTDTGTVTPAHSVTVPETVVWP